jgi:hypothetical protein
LSGASADSPPGLYWPVGQPGSDVYGPGEPPVAGLTERTMPFSEPVLTVFGLPRRWSHHPMPRRSLLPM